MVREEDSVIGDFIRECVDKGSFTSQDMERVIELIRQVGYKHPFFDDYSIIIKCTDARCSKSGDQPC